MRFSDRTKVEALGLTQGQVDCLVLVNQNLTSKEIGPVLGISSHTVDQRIRQAMRVLNVDRRVAAARVVSDQLTPGLFPWPKNQSDSQVEPLVDRLESVLQCPLPVATERRPTNTLTVAQRLGWIVLIGMGAALSMVVYLAGLTSLARMLRGNI